MKINRQDVHYSVRLSKRAEKMILKVGGTNPHGEPLYRVILAQDRVTHAAGEWTIWPEHLSLEERGGLGLDHVQKMVGDLREVIEIAIRKGTPQYQVERIAQCLTAEIDDHLKEKLAAAPLRVETGQADVQLYPFEGWILEKWKPAESFGSLADWEMYRFQGENALGAYPTFGEYELVAGPTPYPLTARQVEDAIRQDFRIIQSRPRSARERVVQMLATVEQRRKDRMRDQTNKAEAFSKDGPASLHNRLSLGAGRVIQEMAKKAGLVGHFGN